MADSKQDSNPLASATNLGAGVGGGLGSAIGYAMSQAQRDKAALYLKDATDQFLALHPEVTPEQAQAIVQGSSAFDHMAVDSTGRADQLAALQALKSRYQSGGLDAQAKADIATVNAQQAQQAAAQRGAVANYAAQRGLSSGGQALSAMRSAGQAAANTSALGGLQAVGAGQGRADAALGAYGQQAAGLQAQDYGQANVRATADDAISRFNAMNQTANNQFNAQQRQNAQQQTYSNAATRAAGAAQGRTNQAGDQINQGKQLEQAANGIGTGIGGIGGFAAGGGF